MAATTASSTVVTNTLGGTVTYNDISNTGNGKMRTYCGTAEIATTSIDEIADVFLLCPIRGQSRVVRLEIANDDLDSNGSPTLAVDVGLYKDPNTDGTSATEVDVDAYASAITQLQAAAGFTDIGFEARAITAMGQTVAADGGESEHNSMRYVGLKVTAAAATAAAGTISWRITTVEP